MKKCPYCYEEIRDKARFCRYCGRGVKGFWIKRIVFVLLVSFMISYVVISRHEIQRSIRRLKHNIKSVKYQIRDQFITIKNLGDDLKTGIEYYKKYGEQLQELQGTTSELNNSINRNR